MVETKPYIECELHDWHDPGDNNSTIISKPAVPSSAHKTPFSMYKDKVKSCFTLNKRSQVCPICCLELQTGDARKASFSLRISIKMTILGLRWLPIFCYKSYSFQLDQYQCMFQNGLNRFY